MSVLNSRRLWTFIIAQVVSIATLIVGHSFKDPYALQMAVTVIGFVEGLAGILITMLTVDDVKNNGEIAKSNTAIQVAAINAGSHPDFPLPLALDQSGETYGSAGVRAMDDSALRNTIADKAQTDARLTSLEETRLDDISSRAITQAEITQGKL